MGMRRVPRGTAWEGIALRALTPLQSALTETLPQRRARDPTGQNPSGTTEKRRASRGATRELRRAITGIEIERLRGIREGKLKERRRTVLVGPSGSGKSTVLDALLIGASSFSTDAIGRVVRRRSELPAGTPWLFERRAPAAKITLHGDEKLERTCNLTWREAPVESGRFDVECSNPA